MCYLMTTFRCPSNILITSWLFTAWWSTWPGNHLVPYVAELVGSCIPIHAHRCLAMDMIDQFFLLFILDLVLRMNHKVPYRSVRMVSCGDAVRFQNSCKCLAQSFHIWHDNHTFVITSYVLYFLCFILQRFLHDVQFDPIEGPGRVATLTERFSKCSASFFRSSSSVAML